MDSILVPTDFSENTKTALNYAIDLANQFSCKLILFNTYKLSHRAGMFIGVEKLMREESREQMASLLKETRQRIKEGANIEGKVAKGEAISTVIRAAEKLEVDMIVMGTQGASGLKEVFIGSTTNGVVNGSKLPVLVVPSSFDYRPFKTVALSVDEKLIGNKTSLEALRMIIYRYNAKVSAFHVHAKGEEISDSMKASLSKTLGGIGFSLHEIEGDEETINTKIQTFVKNENADLLCMIKRDRGFWGNLVHSSVTTKEVFHSAVPILVLHN